MFIPGVNGSIIANSNAPSGSRLKGAYKNSKKRKMPNGGSVDIISTLKELDPNFNKPKNTVNPLVKDALASANFATGMLSLGHFSPNPLAQTAAFGGDIAGALVDVAQSGVDLYEGDNVNAAANVGTAITPLALKNKGYYRSRSLVGGTSPGKYRPISPLNTTQGANPVIKKGLNWNKAILAANLIDMGQNIISSNNTTMRTPQRDNTQVVMRPNPSRPRMPNGGRVPDTYNTQLTPREEMAFTSWHNKNYPGQRVEDSIKDYDLRGAFREIQNGTMQFDERNHLSDKYKKPNHITFSKKSIYASKQNPGGNWYQSEGKSTDEDKRAWYFKPSAQTVALHGAGKLQEYFKTNEPESKLIINKVGPEMPNGGLTTAITNVSPQGDIRYNASKSIGNFKANLQGSLNAPSLTASPINPKLSYNANKFSSYMSPTGLGASVRGNKGYVNYNQTRDGQTMYRDASAGYNTDKVNLNAGVNFRNNSLQSGQVSGSYNFNPNLSVVGNYNVSQGESGLNPNYFAGFKFNKTFKEGGETDDDDDKDMVNGVASILRRVKDKKNRLQLANQLSKQFNREKVKYDLSSFLNKSKVNK